MKKCCVCGTIHKITKHHVLPKCFCRYRPNNVQYKNLVYICRGCHDIYEIHALQLKRKIAEFYGVKLIEHDVHLDRARNYSHILQKRKDLTPERRKKYENLIIQEMAMVDQKNLELWLQFKPSAKDDPFEIICQYLKPEDWEPFAEIWREHFVKTMNPQHLGKQWKALTYNSSKTA